MKKLREVGLQKLIEMENISIIHSEVLWITEGRASPLAISEEEGTVRYQGPEGWRKPAKMIKNPFYKWRLSSEKGIYKHDPEVVLSMNRVYDILLGKIGFKIEKGLTAWQSMK